MTSTGTSTGPPADAQAAPGGKAPIDLLVDWDLAARTAALVARPGPQLRADEAAAAVADLRSAAVRAWPHVAEVTQLSSEPGIGVLIVDRAGWARANAAAFRTVLEPVVEQAFAKRGHTPGAALAAIGSRISGAEVGAVMGFLASRVLGQFDPFGPGPDDGRLMLVAPNVVAAERELGVVPADFRLWVCLHEETHRVQFTANPWLARYLLDQVRSLAGELMVEPSQLAERVSGALRGLPDVVRGVGSGSALLDLLQTPEQRERLAAITAVMSLLEGHADVVMDAVGPSVVPTVETIRDRFTRRREGRSAVDRLLRRLLGLDAKMRQYVDGARFVRQVVDTVGMAGFNAVWAGPQALPTAAEIADPALWIRRTHA